MRPAATGRTGRPQTLQIDMEENRPTRAQMRQHIVKTASKAFHTNGIKSVTMDDIAHLLTMSKRTLYQLFHDKEELILACFMINAGEDLKRIEQILEETDNVLEVLLRAFAFKMEEIGQINPSFFADLMKYPRVVEFHRKRRGREVRTGVEFMNRGKEQGIFRPDIDFNIIIPFMQQQMDLFMGDPAFANYSLQHLFANTLMIMLRGCTTPKGAALMDAFMEKWRAETPAQA